ncbi:hypothetical protein GEMRC1_009704 [Eukaryota sp. GEM-RC1]
MIFVPSMLLLILQKILLIMAFVSKVRIEFPTNYPYKSPSVGFCTPIYHCNVDLASGSICLDVLSQNWSSLYNLNHIFDVFLQQLLMYPNPSDPLNGEAARLLLRSSEEYITKVRTHAQANAELLAKSPCSPSTSRVLFGDDTKTGHSDQLLVVDDFDDLSDVSDC